MSSLLKVRNCDGFRRYDSQKLGRQGLGYMAKLSLFNKVWRKREHESLYTTTIRMLQRPDGEGYSKEMAMHSGVSIGPCFVCCP